MKTDEKIALTEALFETIQIEDFLNRNPQFSERMLYELKDDILEQWQEEMKSGSDRSFSMYVDGASQNQNKKAGIGGVIYLNDSEIDNFSVNIGGATNNEAEYTALIYGLKQIRQLKPERLYIFADSELMVKQINGEYRVKNERIKRLYGKALNALQSVGEWSIEHVPRDRNKRADQLSKQALHLEVTENPV